MCSVFFFSPYTDKHYFSFYAAGIEITCPITCQMSRYESVIDVFAICQALLLQFFDIYKKQQKQT